MTRFPIGNIKGGISSGVKSFGFRSATSVAQTLGLPSEAAQGLI
jgi:hypothetical protein